MNDWMRLFFQGDYSLLPPNWPAILLGLLLAFACGHIIAWVYMFTHSGLSYSRSFVNALIIMPTIVALVMMRDRWDAGEALMAAGNPPGWAQLVADTNLAHDNREKITACRVSANKTKKDERCIITVRGQ